MFKICELKFLLFSELFLQILIYFFKYDTKYLHDIIISMKKGILVLLSGLLFIGYFTDFAMSSELTDDYF